MGIPSNLSVKKNQKKQMKLTYVECIIGIIY